MKSTKDYQMKTHWLDGGQQTLTVVCASNAIDAHSEVWQKLPEQRHKQVDTFEIITIGMCQHQRKVGA